MRNIIPTITLISGLFCQPVQTPTRIQKDCIIDAFNQAVNIEYKDEGKDDETGEQLDYWQTPKETKRLNTGDCEDKALLLQDTLKRKGMESKLALGLMSLTSTSLHAWIEYEKDKSTYILDPTVGVIRRRDRTSPFQYLKMSDVFFKKQMENYNERLKK